MLAQNLKTPAELRISEREFDALRTVLGMLEREEVKTELFDMGSTQCEKECGTAHCIGGYVAALLGLRGIALTDYVYRYQRDGALTKLYFPRNRLGGLIGGLNKITREQGAVALRNFLTHGEPRWREALSA